jgi:hypothetical protein
VGDLISDKYLTVGTPDHVFQAGHFGTMVEDLQQSPLLLDLVRARVLCIEAHGALRESNAERDRIIRRRLAKAVEGI